MTEEDYKSGQVLLIDKPLDWTSFQVVNKLRWHIRQKFGMHLIEMSLSVYKSQCSHSIKSMTFIKKLWVSKEIIPLI